ncbi:hypothetical protein AZI85_15980 [Bdellovibrio bacteriovorus]|uniref:Glycosyltransferase RgtA/B/C/D-like domain-containing protein n=1 Tax=Bdellovibrio bacteriovorus TaxID=959 RepID=A0A150WU04_BDEBC|nr:hypothetical protein [Bdellovibrio bacteriovorus]KYG69891.1 hypothetical protein AZI85_15980 [Bdellovibrio bacteriovorus]
MYIGTSLLLTMLIVSFGLYASKYGIEFTDEGFYLNWISDPYTFATGTTQFGFVYHPLYLLFNGDIIALRQANFLFTLGVSWLVFEKVFSLPAYRQAFLDAQSRMAKHALSFAFSITALLIFHLWLPTPNYNTLNFQSLLLACAGVLFIEQKPQVFSWFGWGLIGVAGFLCFMAKPTSAFLLALSILVYAGTSRRFILGAFVAGSISITLLWVLAIVIDGSISQFLLVRVAEGIADLQALDGGHSFYEMFRLYKFDFSKLELIGIFSIGLLSTLPGLFVKLRQPNSGLVNLAESAAVLLVFVVLARYILPVLEDARPTVLVVALAFGMLVRSYSIDRKFITAKRNLVPFCLFLFMPYIYSFGTNNNYFLVSCSAGLFWIVACLSLCSSKSKIPSWHCFSTAAFLSQIIACAVLYVATVKPYRQPTSLWNNSVPAHFRNTDWKLNSESALYIANLQGLMRDSRFKDKTPVLDLSGRNPSFSFIVNARSLAYPWLIGGYPGSVLHAKRGLSRVSCSNLGVAWLLIEPNGPRSISAEVLEQFDINLASDYEIVGSFRSPKSDYFETFEQIVYKPKENLVEKLLENGKCNKSNLGD